MQHLHRLRAVVGMTLAPSLAATLPTGAAEAAAPLAPHRAIYEITLDRAAAGSGIVELTGRMVYELVGSDCEGWTQNMRFVTRTSSQEGSEQVSDMRTSSWEEAGGRTLRFNASQYRDDQLAEASQGDARRSGNEAITVELAKPERKSVKLASTTPGGILFPVQHSLAMLQSARAGRSSLSAGLYDGSEKGEKVYVTNAVIGQAIRPGASKSPAVLKNGDKLDALTSWPVSISYFEPGSERKDTPPAYEIAFRLFDNGVSTRLHIDYGEFAIKGELKELAFTEPSRCPADGPATPR